MTSEELAALPAESTPFEGGMNANEFGAQYKLHGDAIRWWKGFRVPESSELGESNGHIYFEQTLAAEVRVLLHTTKRETYVPQSEMGVFPRGSTEYSGIPAEIELARGDRILAIDRFLIARQVITRGHGPSEDTDKLNQRFPVAARIYIEQTVEVEGETISQFVQVSDSDFEVVQDIRDARGNRVGGIRWLNNAPPMGTDYLVDFDFSPLYTYEGNQDMGATRGVDGERMPQRGILTMEQG